MEKLTEEKKTVIAERLGKVIHSSLSFPKIISRGVNASKGHVHEIDLESMESDGIPDPIKPFIGEAEVAFAGSYSQKTGTPDSLDYLLTIGKDGRIGCHGFNEDIPETFYPNLLKHLLLLGLNNHDLIHTIHTPDTCKMEEGVGFIARGPAAQVKYHDNGHYQVGVRKPEEVYEMVGEALENVAGSLADALKDALGKGKDKEPSEDCNCFFCEARRAGKLNPDEEKPSTAE